MKCKFYLGITLVLLGVLLPVGAAAQSDDGVSLGDLARSLRKSKEPPAQTVIDNDNLSQVMDDVESQRLKGALAFSLDPSGKNFQISSPDVTCSLSFSANAAVLVVDPYVPLDLPQSELMKLDGPATIDGDTLQVSVYNGTDWNLKEITVGLTIVRVADSDENAFSAASLLPPPGANSAPAEKHSDQTLLFHLKGTAAPLATTVFRGRLSAALSPDEEWHWAIVQAKGIPPSPLASADGY